LHLWVLPREAKRPSRLRPRRSWGSHLGNAQAATSCVDVSGRLDNFSFSKGKFTCGIQARFVDARGVGTLKGTSGLALPLSSHSQSYAEPPSPPNSPSIPFIGLRVLAPAASPAALLAALRAPASTHDSVSTCLSFVRIDRTAFLKPRTVSAPHTRGSLHIAAIHVMIRMISPNHAK
jgi:hypothetical protein